eukprot:515398-Prymnesium_polylepis.1
MEPLGSAQSPAPFRCPLMRESQGADRSLDPGRGSRVARRHASGRLGALRVANVVVADEAALGRIRAHRLDE